MDTIHFLRRLELKFKNVVYYVIMILPMIVTVVMLNHLPERIPTHYGFSNQADRWGSKYELLAFPILVILFGILMRLLRNHHNKNQGGKNEMICEVSGIVGMITFSIMDYYFIYLGSINAANTTFFPIELDEILFGLLGLSLIVIGCILPKTEKNAVTGLRTRWSMKNDLTWRKSQIVGGVSFVISGISIVLIGLFSNGVRSLIMTGIVFVLLLLVDVTSTYFIALKNNG